MTLRILAGLVFLATVGALLSWLTTLATARLIAWRAERAMNAPTMSARQLRSRLAEAEAAHDAERDAWTEERNQMRRTIHRLREDG